MEEEAMIKTQDLKAQIDELTKQNDMMLTELEQMKRLISGGSTNASDGGGSPGQSGGSQQQTGQQQFGQQTSGQQQADERGEGQQQSGGQQARGGQSSGRGSGGQEAQLANDLLQIKDLVARLESKTAQYVSNQSNGNLTDKDVVNLVLTLINGMVDWSSEFVSSRASGSGQRQ
jgi:hypothetical protein